MDEYSDKKSTHSISPEAAGNQDEKSVRQLNSFRRLIGGLSRKALKRYGLLGLSFFIFASFIYLLLSGQGILKHRELEREKNKLEQEIEALQDENRNLRIRLERLRTDTGFLEDEARKKLGLVRPGETVYRLSEEPDLLRENSAPLPILGLEKIDINFSKSGDLFINGEQIAFNELAARLDAVKANHAEVLVIVTDEQSGGDERVLRAMELLKEKGFSRVISGLQLEQPVK